MVQITDAAKKIQKSLTTVLQQYITKSMRSTKSHGATSHTYVVEHLPPIFIKKIIRHKEYHVYEREKHLASLLCQFCWYPPLLHSDDKQQVLVFQHVGEPMITSTMPHNVVEQFKRILCDMASVNVQHNDIKREELLVNAQQKLYLCDFGWASVNNDLGCGIGIRGGDNKLKLGGWRDDTTALERCGFIEKV